MGMGGGKGGDGSGTGSGSDGFRGPGDTRRFLGDRYLATTGRYEGREQRGQGGGDDGDVREAKGRGRGEEPRQLVAGGRGMLDEPKYELISLRTPFWTNELVGDLDDRNKERLRCLPPEWQRHVIMTYATGGEVRDRQKHVSGTIGGVRKLIFAGLTGAEASRLQDVACTGERISYNPCNQYEREGRCRYGLGCKHPHLDG